MENVRVVKPFRIETAKKPLTFLFIEDKIKKKKNVFRIEFCLVCLINALGEKEMKPRKIQGLLVFGCFLMGLTGGCKKESVNDDPHPCNYDGICDKAEDWRWCPDCEIKCNLNEGNSYDYIFTELAVSTKHFTLFGVDLTGDGDINDKFAAILGLIPSCEQAHDEAAFQSLQNGTVIMLGRLVVSDWPNDESMAVQIFRGTSDATEQLFDVGNNHASIAENVDRELHLCGSMEEGHVHAGPYLIHPQIQEMPAKLEISLPFYDLILDLPLEYARVETTKTPITPNDWIDVAIGGVLSKETVNNILIPEFTRWLNEKALEDPDGCIGDFVIRIFDGDCSPVPEGCDGVVPGEGECSIWDPVNEPDGPVLTETEVRCSNLFATALRPDVDTTGDGIRDSLSVGFKVSAVPITIVD